MIKKVSNEVIKAAGIKDPDEYFSAAREKYQAGISRTDRDSTAYYQRLLGSSDKYFNEVVTRAGYGYYGDYTAQSTRKMQEKLGLEKTGQPDEALLYGLELARQNGGSVSPEIIKKTNLFRDMIKEEKKASEDVDFAKIEQKVEIVAAVAGSIAANNKTQDQKKLYEPDNDRFDGQEMKVAETGKVTGYARGCNDGYSTTSFGKKTLDDNSHTFATPLRFRNVEGKPQLGQIAEFTCERTGKTKFGMCENYGSIKDGDADFTPGMANAMGLKTVAASNGAIEEIGVVKKNSKGKEYVAPLERGDIETRVVADTGTRAYFSVERTDPKAGAALRNFSQHMEVVVKKVNDGLEKGLSREEGLAIIKGEISEFYQANPAVSKAVAASKNKPQGKETQTVEGRPKENDLKEKSQPPISPTMIYTAGTGATQGRFA